jgi:GTP cyclohydrolase I/GTP cyclohydrolase-4
VSRPASDDVALRHDVQASAPRVRVSLTRAGVTGIQSVIRIAHGGKERLYAAQLECTVDLDPAHKGVHMSRFPEQIGESIERLVIAESLHVEELASAIARETLGRQGALRSQVRIEAIQSTTRTAPRSGLPSQEISTLIGVATASAQGVRRAVGVRVRGITACPCAQGMVRDHADERLADLGYGEEERRRILDTVPIATHNQRGEATLLLGSRDHVPAEQLAAIAERSMSAPILTLLKRSDELHVVEQAHANPRFVEDVVREMVAGVVGEFPGLEDDAFVQAHQRNFETIHAHDVIAERTGLLGELRAELAGGNGGTHRSLDDWLRS